DVALAAGVAGVARRLEYGRGAALFAGLVVATLSQVALEATAPLNDLVLASFVVAAAYFLISPTRPELALGGLALGLAAGTKPTALVALPALVLLVAVAQAREQVPFALASVGAGIALVGAYGYVQNGVETGSPLGHHREQNQ